MGNQVNLKMLVLALGLLSLTGLAQAGGFDDEAMSTTAFGTAGIHEQINSTTPPRGNAYGRCKEGKKDKKNKPCASPS